MRSYKFLEEVFHKVSSIENTLKVLNQSQLNIEDKVEQAGLLEEIRHEILSHDLVKESLTDALGKKNSTTNSWQLRLMGKICESNSAVPIDLVKSLSKAKIECRNLWRLSHSEASNLEKLKECFADLVKLIREVASIKSQQLKCSKYDSLLVAEVTEKDIREIFPKIGKFFSENIDKITEKKDKVTNIQNITVEKQADLSTICSQKIGIALDEIHTSYDYTGSSIDYDKSDFCCDLFSLLRHSGYAIYQKYLACNHTNKQVTRHLMYETQGLFMERVLGTSREFVEFIQPQMKSSVKTKGKVKASSVEDLYSIFNRVNLSPFLKNADEFTFLAHIMLRTKLEQDIVNGTLEVKDLHDAWLEGMKHYKIPIKAQNELETYFQDEYWVSGMIGYFPSKIIALIAAVQIFSFIKKNHSESLSAVVKGDFSLIITWLSENIYGAKCNLLELLKKITGKSSDVECYTNYLSEKYDLLNK